MNETRLIFHGVILAHHLVTIYHCCAVDYTKIPPGRAKDMASSGPKFFTSWNLMIQTLYFFIAFLLDMSKYVEATKTVNKMKANLTKFNGYLFNTLMFPATLLVFCGFWIMLFINRDWVYPQQLEDAMPWWLNTAIHTTIIPVLLGELFMYVGEMPRPTFKTALIIANSYMMVYTIQFIFHYYMTGIWLYGVFYDIPNWIYRVAIILATFAIIRLNLSLGYWIQANRKQKKVV